MLCFFPLSRCVVLQLPPPPSQLPTMSAEYPTTFRQWILKSKPPPGDLNLSEIFEIETVDIIDEPKEGKFLVKLEAYSHDPAQRGWIAYKADADPERLYVPPIHEGEVMRAGGIGTVVESWNPEYQKGDKVYGYFGWVEYALVDLAKQAMLPMKLPPTISTEEALSSTTTVSIGVLERVS